VLKYLGMTLDYSENKVLRVHMKNYIKVILKEFPYKLGKMNKRYPCNKNLFKNSNDHNEN
jgi:hypothetical protein